MPNSDDLERLFDEAEAGAGAPNKPPDPKGPPPEPEPESECDHAGSDVASRRYCKQCHKLICQFCWSATDPNYCQQCMFRVGFEYRNCIVTDDDGVEHHGRTLTPTPEFNQLRWTPNGKTTAHMLHEMDRDEVIEYIRSYQEALRNAEAGVDIFRARLAAGRLHLDEIDAKAGRSRAAYKVGPKRTVTMDPKTGKQAASRVRKPTAPAAPAIDMQQMMQAIAMLKLQQDMKAKTNPNTKTTTTEKK